MRKPASPQFNGPRYDTVNRPGMSGDSICWERRRTLRLLRGVGNRVLMSPSSSVRENTIGGCVSRSTPIFFWVLRACLGTWWWR